MTAIKSFIAIQIITFLTLTSAIAEQVTEKEVINNYANHVYEMYLETLETAKVLESDIKAFVANPSVQSLALARESWKAARAPYGQTEVFRFYSGPIDETDGPEGHLNAWPLDEAYIDYVVGAPNAGIVNNPAKFPSITKQLLSDLNELGGEKNISTGYHAIEFLLWGQDLSATSAGNRSHTDYVEGVGVNAKRRKQYLLTVSELLIDHLQILVDAWAPNMQNYRADFVSKDPKLALKNILSGMIYMVGDELSGERMYVAWETMGQEDEHSCFSDMTHMDIQWNYWGIENVLSETRILELASSNKMKSDIGIQSGDIHTQLSQIPAPFDQAILSNIGRKKIILSIEAMESLAADLVKLSQDLNAPVQW